MRSEPSCTGNEPRRSSFRWIFPLIVLFLVLGLFLSRRNSDHQDSAKADQDHAGHKSENDPRRRSPRELANSFRREGEPKGVYRYMFDKAANANRFLIAKGHSKNYVPDTDAAAGWDLWIQDENGNERLIAEDVYRAQFSPDGNKIAYTTSDCVLHVEDIAGGKVAKVERAYEPNWRSDSDALVFAQVPEGRSLHIPEVLGLSVFDLNSGQIKPLTDGKWDDVRPHYDPSDKYVLFVSGGRTGLASFWRVSAEGGQPEQVTNLGMEQVNELFVPTPYDRTLWSDDKRWFVYDFKNGDQEEIWGLEFDPSGKYKGAKKLGEGVDPRLAADGKTIVSLRQNGGRTESVEYALP